MGIVSVTVAKWLEEKYQKDAGSTPTNFQFLVVYDLLAHTEPPLSRPNPIFPILVEPLVINFSVLGLKI